MSSPEDTTAPDDVTVAETRVRRSTKPLRVVVGVIAVITVAIASSACTPELIAKQAVATYWGKNSACAVRVVQRESNFQATAVNPTSGTTGLFQIHPVHTTWIKAKYGYDFSAMKNPYKNARVAQGLSSDAFRRLGDGWQPWRTGGRVAPGSGCPA